MPRVKIETVAIDKTCRGLEFNLKQDMTAVNLRLILKQHVFQCLIFLQYLTKAMVEELFSVHKWLLLEYG